MKYGVSVRLRIRHKLFFTLLLTSIIVATSLFLFLQWNFDRGFLNYVQKQEHVHLEQIADQLANYYASQGEGWQFMVENHFLWVRLHKERSLPAPGDIQRWQQDPEPRHQLSQPPMERREARDLGPKHQLSQPLMERREARDLGPRTVLYDANREWVIGGGPSGPGAGFDKLTVRSIIYRDKVVGYLGLVPATELSYSGDLLFVEQQKENFTLVTLVMVGLSVLLSFPVTIHLLRPIKELTAGTRKLIGGQFKTRIPVGTGDELGQLSSDFNMLAMTLEENEKARKQWVADISHELRTPLSVLRGDVEALQDGIRKLEPQAIEPLHGEIMHLERLVNDLYELSMSDIGALTYKKIEIDPVGLLDDTIGLFEQRFSDKEIDIKVNISKDLSLPMLGDPDRIQQLYCNLLANSLRYTHSPGKLEVSVERDGKNIIILFQDSAPGVTSEQVKKLFDRLFRADPSRNRAQKGAGLGLAICKNIVEAHQGSIIADNSPQGGLGFRIEFPLGI